MSWLKKRVVTARKTLDAATKAKRDRTRSVKQSIVKAEKALKGAQQAVEKGPEQYTERVAKARQALEKARHAPELAMKNYAERVERALLQFELASQTRDYNMGTSLKNYIDPRVYKSWGDHVEYDWQKLYTTALKRKFTWVNQERTRWNE